MSWIDFLNPFKKPWYRKDKWSKQDRILCIETVEKHDCPSWDVKTAKLELYRHKDTCEQRLHRTYHTSVEKTVFEDPKEVDVEVMNSELSHISKFKLYEGPKYE